MPGVLEKIRYLRSNPFAHGETETSGATLPSAACRYVIFFTPRSGSSRLTDLLRRAHSLGQPDEFFNPAIVPNQARFLKARSLEDYVEKLRSHRAKQGVFGCEITYLQMLMSFRTNARLTRLINPTAVVFLMREDLVAQAVSVTRMVQTGVSQSVSSNAEEKMRAEADFAYNPKSILSALLRLYVLESQADRASRYSGLPPLRLSYEMLISAAPSDVVATIRQHVGAPASDDSAVQSPHQKLSGDKSRQMIQKFREEHPRLVRWLDRRRAARLASLAPARALLQTPPQAGDL